MGIGEDDYPVAVEGLRQIGRGIGMMVYLQFLESDERAVEHDVPDDGHRKESHQIAVVLGWASRTLLMEYLAQGKARDGAEYIDCLGNDDESQQQQVDIDDVRVVGNEILLIHQVDGVCHHHSRRYPVEQSPPCGETMTPVVLVEIQVG